VCRGIIRDHLEWNQSQMVEFLRESYVYSGPQVSFSGICKIIRLFPRSCELREEFLREPILFEGQLIKGNNAIFEKYPTLSLALRVMKAYTCDSGMMDLRYHDCPYKQLSKVSMSPKWILYLSFLDDSHREENSGWSQTIFHSFFEDRHNELSTLVTREVINDLLQFEKQNFTNPFQCILNIFEYHSSLPILLRMLQEQDPEHRNLRAYTRCSSGVHMSHYMK
jgi:hypothetical protein